MWYHMQIAPRDLPELENLQGRYNRRQGEIKTEYLLWVSLSGSNWILLNRSEANGFWGPGVLKFRTWPSQWLSVYHQPSSLSGPRNTSRGMGWTLHNPHKIYWWASTAVIEATSVQATHERADTGIPVLPQLMISAKATKKRREVCQHAHQGKGVTRVAKHLQRLLKGMKRWCWFEVHSKAVPVVAMESGWSTTKVVVKLPCYKWGLELSGCWMSVSLRMCLNLYGCLSIFIFFFRLRVMLR